MKLIIPFLAFVAIWLVFCVFVSFINRGKQGFFRSVCDFFLLEPLSWVFGKIASWLSK